MESKAKFDMLMSHQKMSPLVLIDYITYLRLWYSRVLTALIFYKHSICYNYYEVSNEFYRL